MVEGQPVEPACNRFLLVQACCLIPRRDLGFDLRIIRPTVPVLVAVGPEEAAAWIDGNVDAIRATNNHLPAALAGRRFLRPPRDARPLAHGSKVVRHAPPVQEGDADLAPRPL